MRGILKKLSVLASRKSRGLALLVASFAVLAPLPAAALVEIDITQGNIEPLPIALPSFSAEGGDSNLAADMTNVIAADLKRSGLFRPLDPASFIQKNMSVNSTPRFGDWRQISAQALVTGTVTKQPDGRLRAEFRLWDVFAAEQMLGQQFYTTPENWRRLSHIIADAIYERLSGEKGYFDTRIVFVDETGPKDKRVKKLAIMDQDGANVRYLTRGDDLVLTPRFSPTSTREQLEALGALWAEHPDCLMQTHLSEQVEEIDWVQSLFPDARDYLDVYEGHGLCGPGAAMGHAIHLEQREREALIASGADGG